MGCLKLLRVETFVVRCFNYSFIFLTPRATVGRMKIILSCCFSAAVLFPVSSFAFDGPFLVKNQFPAFLSLNQPYLEQAATETSFNVSLSHSSVFVMEDSAAWTARLDFELTEALFRYRRDIRALAEFGIDLPVLRATAGFLDSPLSWYHDTFNFPDYGRSARPRNSFLYDVRKNGESVVTGSNNRTGIGDARLTVKKKIRAADPVVSVLADIELPTGDAHSGYGNGSVDAGVALLMDGGIGDEARIYANIGAVQPGDLKADQTIALRSFFYAGAGVEVMATKRLSLLIQCLAQSSPYPKTGISQIDGTGMLLVMGGRYYGASGSYELSLTEDPNTTGAPDFILNVSYKKKL